MNPASRGTQFDNPHAISRARLRISLSYLVEPEAFRQTIGNQDLNREAMIPYFKSVSENSEILVHVCSAVMRMHRQSGNKISVLGQR